MLTELSIRNLGTIKDASFHFTAGLNIITGETGAGKSTLLNALRLLSGGRSDTGLIRADADKTILDGIWELTPSCAQELEEREVTLEGNELFVSRSIQSDGKSRLTVGGRPTPNSFMAELSELLVEIHGQSDQLKLRDPDTQRELLDSFGGEAVEKQLLSYRKAYDAWTALKRKVKSLLEDSGKREIELQYNRSLVERFEELDPQDNEIENTESEIEKIKHMEEISEGLRGAVAILIPEDVDSPSNLIEEAVDTLYKLAKYDGELEKIADQLDNALKELAPAIEELESYASNIDLDSLNTLRELEDRLVELKIFAKPFGGDINRAIEASLKAQEMLAEQEQELDMEQLEAELELLHSKMLQQAGKLTKLREAHAKKLSAAVNVELAGLAMKGVEFVVQVSERSATTHGADAVEFMVETKGKNRRPITKAASGGELSRIMLALELVTSASSSPATLVFDEIDSGMGGSTAIEIGRRLAKLAETHQVILVSHLAQVAAWAETHYVISKEETKSGVETTIALVQDDSRVKEIARLLSGLSESDTGLAHAKELLATANQGML